MSSIVRNYRTAHRFILPPLRDFQIDLVRDDSNEVVCVSSTQIGKTYAYAAKLLSRMWEYRGRLPWWWCAPSYKQSRAAQREMYYIATEAGIWARGPKPPFEANPPQSLVLVNDTACEYRTWDDPSHLMGDPIAGAVIDEGGLLVGDAYAAISTRRSSSLGPLWWIGNPGQQAGIFRGVCARAEEEGRLHRWTWRTKYDWQLKVDPVGAEQYRLFIESEKKSMPEYEFRRLYEAEWTQDEAAVFRGVDECTTRGDSGFMAPGSDRFTLGVDVAQSVDYLCVCSYAHNARRLELRYRTRYTSYAQAAIELKRISKELGAAAVIEDNGPGIALIQEARRLEVKVRGFTTTAQSKQELILNLAADVQEKRVVIADHQPMPHEFAIYRYERGPTGLYRYSAPPGEHDDTVMAAALARWGAMRTANLAEWGWS